MISVKSELTKGSTKFEIPIAPSRNKELIQKDLLANSSAGK
jgi:hypothetical protein